MRAISVATKGWIGSMGIEVATRGIVSGVLVVAVIRRELLRFISGFTRTMQFVSKRTGEIDGS